MCKEREYKRLDTVSNAFSVPVPGTKKEKTKRSSLFFMPSTVLVCHAVASRWSTTAQVPLGKFQ